MREGESSAEPVPVRADDGRAATPGIVQGWHVLVGALVLIVGGSSLLYFVYPDVVLSWGRNYVRGQAKLERKEITVGDHTVRYLEGGRGPTSVLLHALGGNKDSWARFAGPMTSTSHVIALDLPGFGESTRVAPEEYDFVKQVERLDKVVDALGLEKFHLGGHDMGGAIAAMYAARYPGRVQSLMLVAPMGIRTPTMSEYGKALSKGNNPLRVDSLEDLDRFMSYVFVVPPDLPGVIKRGIVKEAQANRAFNERMGELLLTEDRLDVLRPVLPEIPVRTLVIWCDRDKVMHPSGAAVVAEKLENATVSMMENCGHVPHAERPTQAAQAYYEFVEDHHQG